MSNICPELVERVRQTCPEPVEWACLARRDASQRANLLKRVNLVVLPSPMPVELLTLVLFDFLQVQL